MTKFTVAIAGLGARGYDTYAQYQKLFPDRMQIVAIADPDPVKLARAQTEFSVADENCFATAEQMLAKPRLADCAFIATQDSQHIVHAIAALEAGYDLLLEKPVATKFKDCLTISEKARQTGKLVVVCHVLRYTAFFKTVKNIIDTGGIGDIVTIQAIENVGYWHQAHSFVRGNWRKESETSPMILQKCCHDFDIFTYLIGKKCTAVSSFGSLKYFNSEHAPAGSTKRCYDCPLNEECPYSAYKIYLDSAAIGLKSGNKDWPVNIILPSPDEESLKEALKISPYGRCVFRCDNDVVDHQVVNMLFENEITVNFTMTAFTAENARYLKVMGTRGEIVADQSKNTVVYTPFGKVPVVYDINKLATDLSGHGGGDNEMLTTFFNSLDDSKIDISSTITNSIQSHVMAFAAEQSRLRGGEVTDIESFVKHEMK